MIFLREARVTWREVPELRAVLSLTSCWLSSDFLSLLWIISKSPANPTPPLFGASLVADAGVPPSEPTTPISVSFTESSAVFNLFRASSVFPSLDLREFSSVNASTTHSFQSLSGASLVGYQTITLWLYHVHFASCYFVYFRPK